jgi:hypothetical protein
MDQMYVLSAEIRNFRGHCVNIADHGDNSISRELRKLSYEFKLMQIYQYKLHMSE